MYRLTEAERSATTLDRFGGARVPTRTVLGLERRGWRRGLPQDAGLRECVYRTIPGDRAVVVNLDPGIPIDNVDELPEQELREVWVNARPTADGARHGDLRLGELDPVTASELLRDLTGLTEETA